MKRLSGIFYGWVVVAVSALVFAIVRGVNDSFGVFFVAIVDQFGWSRAAVAGIFSCARLVEGAVSIGVGILSDRFGMRRLVPFSAVIVALGLLLASQAQSLLMLYLAYGVVFAIGFCGMGELPHIPVISRWFIAKRGRAIGLAMAGMGLGIVVIVPMSQVFISHLGWRWAYVALAAVVLVGVIPPTLLFQCERPEDMGLLPDGASKPLPQMPGGMHEKVQAEPRGKEWTLQDALHTPALWLIFLMRMLTPFGMMMVVPHHVIYMVGQGFERSTAAFIFGTLGAFSFFGRIIFGSLSDRIGRIPAIVLSYSLSIIGVGILLNVHNPTQLWLLWGHMVIYGLGFGARAPLSALLVMDVFHGRRYGSILGFLEIASGIGGTIGPWFSGYLFDRTGSYQVSFTLSMVFLASATLCAILAGRSGRTAER